MKVKFIYVLSTLICIFASWTVSAQAHRSAYSRNGDSVYYEGRPIPSADARSFIILKHGYAKDRFNVYLDGRILEYVDPEGFKVRDFKDRRPEAKNHRPEAKDHRPVPGHGKGPSYHKSQWDVFFDGRKVEDAAAHSFVDLGGGYGKDAFNVFYMGRKLDGAFPSSFVIDKDGYAHDAFSTYHKGKKVSN